MNSKLPQAHMTLTLKNCRAKIRLSTKSKRAANSICAALSPDLSWIPKESGKGGSKIFINNYDVFFKIGVVDDVATLRAIINSCLRLADASYRCLIYSQK